MKDKAGMITIRNCACSSFLNWIQIYEDDLLMKID